MFIWCIHTKRKSCDASHSRSSAGDQYDSDNSKKWRDHVYLDNRECVQEIFALTFAIGTVLALAAAIPA